MMKVAILIFFATIGVTVSSKTVSVAAPNCNFDVSIKAPTSKCCCPPPTPKPVDPSSENTEGCPLNLIYDPPTCVATDGVKFPASVCIKFYFCDGNRLKYDLCPPGQTFSNLQQKCVTTPRGGCCVY